MKRLHNYRYKELKSLYQAVKFAIEWDEHQIPEWGEYNKSNHYHLKKWLARIEKAVNKNISTNLKTK